MGLFGKTRSETVALIDVGSASVGGALATFTKGETPTLIFTERIAIDGKLAATPEEAMLAALNELGKHLIEDGSPILRKETGSGQVHAVFAAVASPWQETKVSVETIEEAEPFIFTRAHLEKRTKAEPLAPDRMISGEFVVATLLNGYEVNDPFGKHAKRADMVVLSSTLSKSAANAIHETLRRWYHAHEVPLAAFAPLAYDVFRDLFPHEKDFLVIDVTGESTDVAFVKKGLLVDVASVPFGTATLERAAHTQGGLHASGGEVIDPERNGYMVMRVKEVQEKWVEALSGALRGFSARHALPRSIFLLSDDAPRDYLKRFLDNSALKSLWLSDDPLTVLPILPSQFTDYVRTKGQAVGDVFLMMLALSYDKHRAGQAKK